MNIIKQIECCGKRLDNGELVYGVYIPNYSLDDPSEAGWIVDREYGIHYAVEPKTVELLKKATLTTPNETAIPISANEARKSYADFMKIDEKILMLLNEDESAFYFLHCKKDTCWKTSVSKKERELFRALDRLTEKEIESYNKWLIKQAQNTIETHNQTKNELKKRDFKPKSII